MKPVIDSLESLTQIDQVQRLFHGRGGRFSGLNHICLDWFPDVLLLTSFDVIEDDLLADWHRAIEAAVQQHPLMQSFNLVYQCRAKGHQQTQLLAGEVPEPHIVQEGQCRYLIHLMRGQNHGLFLDMANGRNWVQNHANGAKVLNLFAYTCAFSCVAMAGGAQSVVNMDMSRGALNIGKRNHQLNGFESGVRYFSHDIFSSFGKLKRHGPYDLIVADPPSYQKGSFIASKDYPRLLRRLPELLEERGELLLCLNAPNLDSGFLREQVAQAAPELVFAERLANPAVFADSDEERSLKVLRYRKR
ncbi:class I SAM-dependent methyltransferase [Paraferrimonas sedimenticola]|uniref:S-adenosylmethionine-dependent methyltransferase n=1 Tax=Paraferrimonas sedimenticola TaxID=375674 RepID=A0AA37RRG0_9GAMM|nr:class I SAM-dependent methyltransferase [Paraferrimonas sedimenticola]GLP94818.1 S-adenosylmethionine-dependent methyltransferase [Paraferrimonas sedimenticola]